MSEDQPETNASGLEALPVCPALTVSKTLGGGFLVLCDGSPPLIYATIGEVQSFIGGYFKVYA